MTGTQAVAPETPDRVLSVERLTVAFGGLVAVSDLSFEARMGEILSIIGPNGAGKTTVFNCITGFQRPTSGRIVFEGRAVAGLRPDVIVGRGIARTFKLIRVFPDLQAVENVMLGLHARTRSGTLDAVLRTPRHRREEAWVKREARRWLEFVGLEARAQQRARELAYGDQRRLEIARAMATGPRLIILDEPASGMNSAEKDGLVGLVRTIRQLGVTVLLVEHDMGVVMGVSDRIIVLNYGVQIAEGVPEEVQRNPAVVEAYLGQEEDGA